MGNIVKNTIYIKHMCCQRCIEAVIEELEQLDLKVNEVSLGQATYTVKSHLSLDTIEKKLNRRGFELLTTPEEKVTESVKLAIINLVHNSPDQNQKIHLREYLEKRIKRPYQQIHKVFAQQTNLSIEKYLILQRIEKVKELVQQNQLSFSEIAFTTGYKTQQHLSAQFKKVTGVSMMQYKMADKKQRISIDKI